MGGIFSSRRKSKVKTKRKGAEFQVFTAESRELATAPSVEERKARLYKSASNDELSVDNFEDYVRSKKNHTPPPRPRMNPKKFEKECIHVHNQYRDNHGAPPLTQKSELTKHAQQWAERLAAKDKLEHSGKRDYGENVAMTSKENPTADEITAMWYDEIKKYNFGSPGFTSGTGHFTQVVWNSSKYVGIGIARGRKGTYVVANYEPAGNISNPGYFEKNVARKSKAHTGKLKRRDSSSSSSSSSSSDDEGSRRIVKRHDNGPDDERDGTKTEVKTATREFTDKEGRRVREITKTTITTTTKGGSKSTKTKTETSTEYLKDSSSGRDGASKMDSDMGKLEIKGGDKGEQKMSRSDIKKFEEECIKRHNEFRSKHGVPNLKRSSSLHEKAQKWAEHLLKTRRLAHSNETDLGENVAYKYSSDKRKFRGDEICDMWYDEIKNYNFNKPGFGQNTGHFTQVVWEESKEIGVGVASDGHGTTYAVANYSPAGNFRGKFETNVKKAKK